MEGTSFESEDRPKESPEAYVLTEEELAMPWEELFRRVVDISDPARQAAYYKRATVLRENEKRADPNYNH